MAAKTRERASLSGGYLAEQDPNYTQSDRGANSGWGRQTEIENHGEPIGAASGWAGHFSDVAYAQSGRHAPFARA